MRAKFETPDHGPTTEELGTVEDISGMVAMDVRLLTWACCVLMNKWIVSDTMYIFIALNDF